MSRAEIERILRSRISRTILRLQHELTADLATLAVASPPRRDFRAPRQQGYATARPLSKGDELEFRRNRFNGRFQISLTGQLARRKSNTVFIDDAEVVVPDADFKLLLRLVVGLYESGDGYFELGRLRYGGGLADEGIFEAEGIYQAVSRLRARLDPALIDLEATQFVEVRRGQIRLSTHRRYISFDKEQLLRHPDEVVRSLAEHLPADGSVSSSGP